MSCVTHRVRRLWSMLGVAMLACGGDSASPPRPPALTTTLVVANVAAAVDVPLTATPVTATGGSAPYSYTIDTALPAELRLDAATGVISGTPAGTFAAATFAVTVTDAARATSTKAFRLSVDGPQGTDLSLDALTAPPAGALNTPLAVSARVRNRGARTSEPFRVGLYLSADATITSVDRFLGACTVAPGLASGATFDCNQSLSLPPQILPGSYFVGAIADDQVQTGDVNRANNTRASATQTVLSPPLLPDLVVDTVTAPRATTHNSVIPVAATIRNQGTAAAGSFHVGFYFSTDTIITRTDVPAEGGCSYATLAVGGSAECRASIRVPSSLNPGVFYVGAIVDDSGTVVESRKENNARASVTSTIVTEPTLNLSIEGMYLTQAAQTFDGSVPLAAGRPALLRVFVRANQANTALPDVRVRFYRNGTLVETRTIAAPTRSVPTVVDEAVLTSSWNASIPGSIIAPGLSVVAEVDPEGLIGETSETDNAFPQIGLPRLVDVRPAPPFNVMLVPVVQLPNGLQGDVTAANRDAYVEFANRVYPFAAVDAAVHAPYAYGAAVTSTYNDTWDMLLLELDAMRLVEGSTRNYHGVIKPAYASGATGRGTLGGYASIGIDRTTPVPGTNTDYRSMTAAHEWGHSFGRRHVDCGGPESVDPTYPHPNGSIGTFGYDLTRNELLAPTTFRDLLSYCTPLWISDYTYRAVLEYRARTATPAAAVAQRSLLVWGRIKSTGLILEPAFEVVAPPSLPARGGSYHVQASDDAGRTLFELSFDGTEVADTPAGRQFAFVVPLGESSPTVLRFVADGRETSRRTRIPSVREPGLEGSARRVGNRVAFTWNDRIYPMALVRDAATNEVLSFARDGRIELATANRTLDVTFSDGVRSVRRVIPVVGSR